MHSVLLGGGSGEGDVLQIVMWNKSGYRGGVKVRWKDTKKEGLYRMGGEGCIDVIYINDVMSDQYYLPVVGELIDTICSFAFTCYNINVLPINCVSLRDKYISAMYLRTKAGRVIKIGSNDVLSLLRDCQQILDHFLTIWIICSQMTDSILNLAILFIFASSYGF